jgi:hypothetical protein
MDRRRPESRVVFVQLPIPGVGPSITARAYDAYPETSAGVKGLPRFSLCAPEQEYLLDDPLKASRTETCKNHKINRR